MTVLKSIEERTYKGDKGVVLTWRTQGWNPSVTKQRMRERTSLKFPVEALSVKVVSAVAVPESESGLLTTFEVETFVPDAERGVRVGARVKDMFKRFRDITGRRT